MHQPDETAAATSTPATGDQPPETGLHKVVKELRETSAATAEGARDLHLRAMTSTPQVYGHPGVAAAMATFMKTMGTRMEGLAATGSEMADYLGHVADGHIPPAPGGGE
ncbi:hypothetical protein D5S17_28950 [Pseudonocardiaceae bacterium YIM PH 21723]|nr:hypothetical protein D5S17_28950 [Pseudonocardiaceae bacterium YIM PH 21723]